MCGTWSPRPKSYKIRTASPVRYTPRGSDDISRSFSRITDCQDVSILAETAFAFTEVRTRMRNLASDNARVRPAGPAPTMSTSVVSIAAMADEKS